MGRTVANAEFLRALLQADPFDAYHFFLPEQKLARQVHSRLQTEFGHIEQRGGFVCKTRHSLAKALRDTPYYCFHLSDSLTGQSFLARLRNALAADIFPITGITHSLSYAGYPAKFLEHIWPGVTKRDAVVATSSTGKNVVEHYFNALRTGFGLDAATYPAPHVPVIPLGVTPMFHPGSREHETMRAISRQRLDVADHEPVFLVFARLSHYSKMDLLPLLFALQRAESMGLQKEGYLLVIAGQNAPGEHLAGQLRALAANANIRLRIELAPDDVLKAQLYAAADIFVSPVDNVQETFGITLIEAAAAGLPVIASDYDGYKDIVAHGETGLLIPTIAPAVTTEQNILAPLLPDSQYHLELAQQTVVDVPQLARALARLGTDENERKQMGAQAKIRCDTYFVWPKVIEHWLALWEQLRAAPVNAESLRTLSHPLETNFGAIFAAYPTTCVDEGRAERLYLRQSRKGGAVYREQEFPVIYAGIEGTLMLDALRRLLINARNATSYSALKKRLLQERLSPEAADFLILWACKQDLLEFCEAPANPPPLKPNP